MSTDAVARVRQRFVEDTLDAALSRKKRAKPSRERTPDGRAEARRIAARPAPPARRPEAVDRADAGRRVGRVGGGRGRVRRDGPPNAPRNEIRPWLRERWCVPPKASAEFVRAVEDVLDVHHRPYDEARPVVRLDETSKQLVGEVVEPTPAEPGPPERFDYEYVRNGTANLFMIPEPLAGWRHVMATERRTAKDFAEVLRWLAGGVYPEAERIVLVMDDLNTHKLASLHGGSCSGTGPPVGRAVRGPPHAQARQPAERGGDRVERAGPAMPGPADRVEKRATPATGAVGLPHFVSLDSLEDL